MGQRVTLAIADQERLERLFRGLLALHERLTNCRRRHRHQSASRPIIVGCELQPDRASSRGLGLGIVENLAFPQRNRR
jgi:hypothetical protein